MRIILLIGILLANSLYMGCSEDNNPTIPAHKRNPPMGTTRTFDIDGGLVYGDVHSHTHICTDEEAQKLCIGLGYEDLVSKRCANFGSGSRIYQVTCWKR
jgi:hypothetical protein